MLTFDSVKLRLDREQPLTFLEFNYMILQAYDFRQLSRDYGCRLQMGGSRPVGQHRQRHRARPAAWTGPRCSASPRRCSPRPTARRWARPRAGAVWLNEDQLPSYDFWQYWRNTDDRDVGRFLRLFTDLPLDEIARLEALEGAEINQAKIVLANEVTRLVRGEDAARAAEATAAATFAGGGLGEDLPVLDRAGRGHPPRRGAAPTLGFTASNGEAKRKIAEGAVRLDDEPHDRSGHARSSSPRARSASSASAASGTRFCAAPDRPPLLFIQHFLRRTDLDYVNRGVRDQMAGGAQLSVPDMRRSTRHPVDFPVIGEHRTRGDLKLHVCNLSAHGFMVDAARQACPTSRAATG